MTLDPKGERTYRNSRYSGLGYRYLGTVQQNPVH